MSLEGLNDGLYHPISLGSSDNSRGENITLSEDGYYFTFLKSGMVDFTVMASMSNKPDIYMQFIVAKINDDGSYTTRIGSRIRAITGDDQESCMFRRILHVNAGEKYSLVFLIPTWCSNISNGTIYANIQTSSTGLMAQYVAYD